MPNPRLEALVAIARNGVIGNEQSLPWHLKADLVRFKKITLGHSLLMGRKTYESIGRPLPGRKTWILTRNPEYRAAGCETVTSWQQLLDSTGPADRVFLVGGAEIYDQLLKSCGVIHITRVLADIPGDTRLTSLSLSGYRCEERVHVPADLANDWPTYYERWTYAQ